MPAARRTLSFRFTPSIPVCPTALLGAAKPSAPTSTDRNKERFDADPDLGVYDQPSASVS